MKRLMLGGMAATLIIMALPAAAAPGDRGIDARQQRQHQRIAEGSRSGDLTRGEAHALRGEQRAIRREEARARADGVVTPRERAGLHRDLDRSSRHIHDERHDAQRRWAHERGLRYGWRGDHRGRHDARSEGWGRSGGWVDRRQAQQRERIREGISSGDITRHEARRLFAEQRAIDHRQRHYLADGRLTREERADLRRDLGAASRHIYRQSHDDQYRP